MKDLVEQLEAASKKANTGDINAAADLLILARRIICESRAKLGLTEAFFAVYDLVCRHIMDFISASSSPSFPLAVSKFYPTVSDITIKQQLQRVFEANETLIKHLGLPDPVDLPQGPLQ